MPDASIPHILILDDDRLSRQLVERVMRRQRYAIESAGTAEEALELLRRSPCPFDLLISDVILPRMNGDELAQVVHREFPALPILFISGMHQTEIAVLGVVAKTFFLQKPFLPGELVARSQEILAAAA